jgi:hypothetical protein
MDIILIPGMWLTGSAWDETAEELRRLGHHPTALTLPGLADGPESLDAAVAMARGYGAPD